MLNQCQNSVTNTDPELMQHRVSVTLNKRRISVAPASTTPGQPKNETRSTARARRRGVIFRN